jgi:hypothetical protein
MKVSFKKSILEKRMESHVGMYKIRLTRATAYPARAGAKKNDILIAIQSIGNRFRSSTKCFVGKWIEITRSTKQPSLNL